MKRPKLVYHPFFTHCRSGRTFNLRPSRPWFEPFCLFVCLLICLFVCIYHGSDITTCTTSSLQILVTLCNDVRNGFSYNYMATSKHSSTQFLNAILSSFRVIQYIEPNSRAPVLLNLLSLSRISDKILGKPHISSLFTALLITSILGSNVIFYALPPARTPGWC